MKFTRVYLIIFVLLVPELKALAQADISMATHWNNRANYNPASIARTDYLYLFSNLRQQWLGVNGAPRVFNVQASQYVDKIRSAFGLSLVGDKIGAVNSFNPMATYAYRIAKHQDWALSFGISAGVFANSVNGSLFEPDIANDPSIYYGKEKSIRPDFNAGVEFQNSNFVLGVSSTHISSVFKTNNLYLNTNHRYGYAIYKNTGSKFFNYNIGLQVVNRSELTVMEINTIFRIKHLTGLIDGLREVFDVGLTYRTSRQMTVLFGVNISSNARIGYAYDHSFMKGYNPNGTHEIVLECRFLRNAASTRLKCGDDLFWYY